MKSFKKQEPTNIDKDEIHFTSIDHASMRTRGGSGKMEPATGGGWRSGDGD